MSRYAINAVGPSFYAGAGSVSPAFQPVKRKPVPARKAALRCPHCGAEGERAGHQDCQYPQDMQ